VLKASVTGKVPEGWSCDKAVAYITGATVGGAAVDYILKDKESLEGKVDVGSAVLQWLALEKKIRVMAVCSGKKAKVVTDLGAEAVSDYTQGPWEGQLPYATPKVDYVFDFAGGTKVEAAAKKVLNRGGQFITAVGPSDKSEVGVDWGSMIQNGGTG
jgi:NADPH:quinone reductase-like Zn-dependent oxidoreductase